MSPGNWARSDESELGNKPTLSAMALQGRVAGKATTRLREKVEQLTTVQHAVGHGATRQSLNRVGVHMSRE